MKHMRYFIRLKNIKYVVFFLCLFMIFVSSASTVFAQKSTKNTKVEEQEILGYVGKVTGRVNVRVAAGAKNETVKQNGQIVKLQRGEEVLILSEVMVGSKPWYKVRFSREGEEITGFSTSTYIKKTDQVITPSPLPTPTATPTPEPTATPMPTQVPSITLMPTAAPQIDAKQSGSDGNMFLFIALGVVIVGGGTLAAVVILRNQQQKNVGANEEVLKKVEQLKHFHFETKSNNNNDKNLQSQKNSNQEESLQSRKNLNQEESLQSRKNLNQEESLQSRKNLNQDKSLQSRKNPFEEKQTKTAKRKPEIKSSNITSEPHINKRNTEDNLDKNNGMNPEEEFAVTSIESLHLNKTKRETQSHSSNLVNGSALREDIERLREHDIIIHKFFGRGEVFDNSDVKLIEIRFGGIGGDARFLNKDTLASKKLITITSERNI